MIFPLPSTGAVFSASSAATWTRGVWQGLLPDMIAGIFTDTRTPIPGALFIALRGPHFDGHVYAQQAFAAGACAVMADADATLTGDFPVLRVTDTRKGLEALAAGWRARVAPCVIGITGSAGKTTVKEWTAHLLSAVGPTVCTPGNWNNDLGLPKSMLAMPKGTAFAVLEAGTSHPGEICDRAALMRPDSAIITNVGVSHIAFFGTEAAIADEKADLLRVLPSDGLAVLDADSPHFAMLASQVPCRLVTVSLTGKADYSAFDIDVDAGVFTVVERATGETCTIMTRQPGRHQIVNALQALAIARHYGLDWTGIVDRFASLPGIRMRWERIERRGIVWINDAYNANPVSMARALETFGAIDSAAGMKLAVLGDMFELGSDERRLHEDVGRHVARCGIDMLVAVGTRASTWLADAAVEAGFKREHVYRTTDIDAARGFVTDLLVPGAYVLLKGSRGMALERMLE